MSLSVGLQLAAEEHLAGLVVLSGYLPGAKRFKLTPGIHVYMYAYYMIFAHVMACVFAGLEDTPIFHGHGASDPMVRRGGGGVVQYSSTAVH